MTTIPSLDEHEKKLLRQKAYRERNKEILNAKFKLYYMENRHEINARRRQAYLNKKSVDNVDVSDN